MRNSVEFTRKGFGLFFGLAFGTILAGAILSTLFPVFENFIIQASLILMGFSAGFLVSILFKTEEPEFGKSFVKVVNRN